jgi:hypothetical protein
LPDAPTSLPVLPARPVVREDSPDEIQAIDSLPEKSVAVSAGRKRGAPDDGVEVVDAVKKPRTEGADGAIVIE